MFWMEVFCPRIRSLYCIGTGNIIIFFSPEKRKTKFWETAKNEKRNLYNSPLVLQINNLNDLDENYSFINYWKTKSEEKLTFIISGITELEAR